MKETLVDKWIATKKLSKLLDLWVKGLEFDWHKLYGEQTPTRIEVPVYPFAKERYWMAADESSYASVNTATSSTAYLHPLLHSNTSTLAEQGYTSTFTGEEMFVVDQSQKPQRISLPTYPFAKDRCWADIPEADESSTSNVKLVKNFDFIEDLINKIDNDSIETQQAVKLLKSLA